MSENPYESPARTSSMSPPRNSLARTIGAILVLLAMFPAAAIASLTVCLAVAENAPRAANDRNGVGQLMTGLIIGCLAGAFVFGVMFWCGIKLTRPKIERPKSWIKSDGAEFEAFYISQDNNQVTLRQADGSEIQIPLAQLCGRDREWLRDYR